MRPTSTPPRAGRAAGTPAWLLIAPLLLAGPIVYSTQTPARSATRADYTGWAAYGGSPDQIRYSSLKQINTANVKQLAVAWTYDSGESGGLQTQPIVAGGVLYAYTPTHKTFAVRAGTGEPLWTFDPGIVGRGANRGVMYWTDGTDARVYPAVDQYLYGLDAKTGTADRGVRRQRPDRSAPRPRSRSQGAERQADQPGRRLQRSPDRRRPRRRGAAIVTGPHPGLRREDRRPAMDVSHDPAPGRAGVRDVGQGVVDAQRRRQQLGRNGARRGTRDCVRADRIGRRRLLRRGPPGRQPLRELPARAQRGHRAAHLALPGRAPRSVGSRSAVPAKPRPAPPERADDRCRRADDEARLRVRLRSHERHAAVPDRVPEVSGDRRSGRDHRGYTAAPDEAETVRAAAADRRPPHEAHARSPRVGGCRIPQVPQRPVRAVHRRSGHGDLSGIRRGRGVGRLGRGSRDGDFVRQRERHRVDGRAGPGGGRPQREGALPAALRVLSP